MEGTSEAMRVAARAIHRQSRRAGGPFVAINCAALAINLIQSELFGHEKGAFTGAHRQRIGHIETAYGGTIFLDEIGDMSYELQINLLRFLQKGMLERVGGTRKIPVDARVIAATHVNLNKAIAEDRFPEDLYYRLDVLSLRVPPLRNREQDASETLDEVREAAEQQAIRQALSQHGQNVSRAAEALAISRRQLYRLMEKYGLIHMTLYPCNVLSGLTGIRK